MACPALRQRASEDVTLDDQHLLCTLRLLPWQGKHVAFVLRKSMRRVATHMSKSRNRPHYCPAAARTRWMSYRNASSRAQPAGGATLQSLPA